MLKKLSSGIILIALVTPAFAANYWVVLNSATNVCSIVEQDQKPTNTRVFGTAYQSSGEAEKAINDWIKACGATH